MNKILSYTINVDDVFESIVKEDSFELNHVVIKPKFFFPAHPTDANVLITVTKGELWLTIEDQEQKVYKAGTVIQADKGTMTVLGNGSEDPTEVFVIKRR